MPRSNCGDLLQHAFADLPPRAICKSSPFPASARPPPPCWSPRSSTSTASPRPTTSSATSASSPRKTAPASISTASPCRPARMRMSPKGNDLVRSYLWNAARAAIVHNPAIRALYRRLQGQGQTRRRRPGPLHAQAAAPGLSPSGRPTAPSTRDHFHAWDAQTEATRRPPSLRRRRPLRSSRARTAGRQRNSRGPQTGRARRGSGHHGHFHRSAAPAACQATRRRRPRPTRPKVDFAFLRQQVTMEQVLQHLGLFDQLRGRGPATPRALPAPRPAPATASEPSRCIWARTSSSASRRTAAPKATSWTCGQPSTSCRCTRPRCIWQRPSTCPGTEKRNPLQEPVEGCESRPGYRNHGVRRRFINKT